MPVELENNVFLRVPVVVQGDGRKSSGLTLADHNAMAPPPREAFDRVQVAGLERGRPGWSRSDIQAERPADLGFTREFSKSVPDLDADIQSGAFSVAAFRERIFAMYRLGSESKLSTAGRPSTAGAERPSIGPAAIHARP
jgi:hypothetical protein